MRLPHLQVASIMARFQVNTISCNDGHQEPPSLRCSSPVDEVKCLIEIAPDRNRRHPELFDVAKVLAEQPEAGLEDYARIESCP